MDYTLIKEQMNTLKLQAQAAAQEYFSQGCKELFAANPDLKSFSWTQYTPYFNDGDECVFSADTDYPHVNGIDEYGEGSGEDEEYITSKEEQSAIDLLTSLGYQVDAPEQTVIPPSPELYEEVKTFLNTFDDDDLLHLYGDHCRITVTRAGIQKEEYDHD